MLSLTAGLLLAPLAAHAGSYVGAFTDPNTLAPTPYSGGTHYSTTGPPVQGTSPFAAVPDGLSNGSYGGASSGDGNGGNHSDCSGAISTSWTWVPATGQTATTDPPPTLVIITQTCSASVSMGIPGGVGTYNTGLSQLSGQRGSVVCAPPTVSGGSASGTYYFAHAGGATVTLDALSATATASNAFSSAIVGYTAAVYPVTINPGGATQDTSGNWNILVGQHCAASLSGIPSNCTVSNYQWSVSGTTFQTWSADTPPFPVMVGTIQIGITPDNPDATYEVDGPGSLTNSTAGWYWNDLAQGTGNSTQETISCTATVTPPAGQGSAFTVSATLPITVWTPVWTGTGNGSVISVDNKYSPPDFWLHAGYAITGLGAFNGMTWNATLSPPPSPVSFGVGSLALVQIITSNDCGFMTNTTLSVPLPYSNNGQTGLDTSWPYPWEKSSPTSVGGMYYTSGDSPGVPLTLALSAHDNVSFEDHLMYCPPGSVQYVSVAKYIWSANMSATLPATGNRINFTGSAGTISDSQKAGTFLPSNTFPAWTQIVQ